MPKTRSPSVLGSGRVLYLPTARIRPNPMQPRKHFDTGGLQELAGSIRQYGVLQPLTVRKAGGAYELVAGERRLRAARLAGLTEVPCLLADVDEEASGMLALVENLQRRDLDYIEEAEGLQKLMQQYHLSQEQAARRIGKSQSAVANKLRILRHPPSVLQALREHHLTERHARALLRLPDEEERLRVIGLIVQGEWTVAKTEQYIDARLARLAFIMLPVVGFQIIISNFFQSISKAPKAIFMSLSRQVIFLIPSLYLFSKWFGLTGVWLSIPFSDLLAALVALILILREKRFFYPSQQQRA